MVLRKKQSQTFALQGYETARKSRHSRELRQNGRRRSQEPITATARRLNTGGGDGDHFVVALK